MRTKRRNNVYNFFYKKLKLKVASYGEIKDSKIQLRRLLQLDFNVCNNGIDYDIFDTLFG